MLDSAKWRQTSHFSCLVLLAFFCLSTIDAFSDPSWPYSVLKINSILLPTPVHRNECRREYAASCVHTYRRRIIPVLSWRETDDNDEKYDNNDEKVAEEKARLQLLESRRYMIRSTLKAAESIRNFRLRQGLIPKLDETGKPQSSDGKLAVTLTAFVVAAGAIVLRIGGRAALVSAVGLDFVTDNPELKNNFEQVLNTAETMDPVTKILLFLAGWTAVKVLCFDAGGVVLALSSGILFGGVVQGAVISSAAATIGSSLAFGMAKLDTPIRKKALQVLEEYPSLRGIEKIVARDGLKAVLTLRLAPILPIPIGLYNYIYGVTNVPVFDFCGGIFLGSLKPYLLDSYLGYFGKSVVEGTNEGGLQDALLLAALGLSVLIGVFASQLAGETWESVLAEVEAEKTKKLKENGGVENVKDGNSREFLGWKLPQWIINFQHLYENAENRITKMVTEESIAEVWNYTKQEGGPPAELDPAAKAWSPERSEVNSGFDIAESLFDSLVLTPTLVRSFVLYSDPFYKDKHNIGFDLLEAKQKQNLISRLDAVQELTVARIKLLDERLKKLENESSLHIS